MDFKSYRHDVLYSGINMLQWQRDLASELVKVLWDEGVIVDYIWFMASSYPKVTMHAIVVDNDDEAAECIAVWEYDKSQQSIPEALPWELVSVDIGDLPPGLV
jgi:hypothetical protein